MLVMASAEAHHHLSQVRAPVYAFVHDYAFVHVHDVHEMVVPMAVLADLEVVAKFDDVVTAVGDDDEL